MPKFDAEDVEQCIIDGNDYKDCVDRMVATMKSPVELENVTDEWYDEEGNYYCAPTEKKSN